MKYATTFTYLMDPCLKTDFPRVTGGGFPPYNALAKMEVATGKHEVFFPSPRYLVQDRAFIPHKAAKEESSGYVMALLNNYGESAAHAKRGDDLRHVLLRCLHGEEELADFRGDIRKILNTSPGATATVRLILRTKLLDRFETIACESYAESRRSAGEERRGSEGRSSGIGVPQ